MSKTVFKVKKSVFNPNGVPPCLNFAPEKESIGKSCATCANRDGAISSECGIVVEVWCVNRKMHEPPIKLIIPSAVATMETSTGRS